MKKALFIALAASFVLAENSYYHEGKKVILTPTKESRTLDGKEVKFFRNSLTNQVVGITPKVLFAPKEGVSLVQIEEKLGIKKAISLSSIILATDTDTPESALELSSRLYESGLVKFAHPNLYSEKQKRAFTPTDPLYKKSWHLTNTATVNGAHINIDGAWAITKGKGVKVAVYDDAVLTEHEDLKPNVIEALDALSDEKSCAPKTVKDTHGTFVAGVAVAATNDKGSLGVAPEASLVGMRGATGGATDEQHIAMFNYVKTSGIGVMNNSWGGYNVTEGMKTTIIDVAKNGRSGKGVVIVFAYGNDSCNDLSDTQCKKDGTGDEQGFLKNDESSIDEAFTVIALNQKNEKSSYSNWGTKADIAAPGGDGDEITENRVGMVSTINKNITESSYASDDPDQVGTSYAAPVIAGVSALMMAANPNLTAEEVMQIIKDTADKVGNYTYTNGRSNETGYGKVNATKAVQKAYEMAGGMVSSSSSNQSQAASSAQSSSATSASGAVKISLQSGWNLIGNPQTTSFSTSGIEAMTIWSYDGGLWSPNPTSVAPCMGFWVKMAKEGEVNFSSSGCSLDSTKSSDSWTLYGAGSDITDPKNSLGAEYIWTYSKDNWTPNPQSIKAGEGFWMKGKITTSTQASSQSSSTGTVCTTDYTPVCGSDGKTYSNSCVAGVAGITTYTSGECAFSIKSNDIQDGAEMALKHAGKDAGGQDISPQISWSGVPSGTKTLALEMIDLDYQNSKHWIVLNIPTSTTELPQGVANGHSGITFGTNDYSSNGSYAGPFPPAGSKHRYQFTLYALSASSVTTLDDAKKHIISSAKFTPVFTGK